VIETMEGGCACGRIRFSAQIDDHDAYLCHCRMCQRASGSVSLAMKGIARDHVAWSREPDWYDSSPIARRPFCARCGTTLGFQFNDSDAMDLTIAAFDDPSPFRPVGNFCIDSMNRAFADVWSLPGTAAEDIESVPSRWIATTGEFPG